MPKCTTLILITFILLNVVRGVSQQTDSLRIDSPAWPEYIFPGILVSCGVTSICNSKMSAFHANLKDKICGYDAFQRTHLDDFVQYAPGVAVLGLNIAGVRGKSKFKDLILTNLLSNAILTGVVCASKGLVHEERPDKSAYNSFPSGHTAAAFAGAELLRQEYKDRSVWYGVAGYTCAAAAGYFRMYNNRHSLSDVLAGAGVGIASTKLAYFTYGKLKSAASKRKRINTLIATEN